MEKLPSVVWQVIAEFLLAIDVIAICRTCRALHDECKRLVHSTYVKHLTRLHKDTPFIQVFNELRANKIPFIMGGPLIRYATYGHVANKVCILRPKDTEDVTPERDFKSFARNLSRGYDIYHPIADPQQTRRTRMYGTNDITLVYYYPEALHMFREQLAGDVLTQDCVFII